jgi:hypothetical protein
MKMKKSFLVFILLFGLTAFSQETYHSKNNGSVFDSNNKEVSPVKMREILANNSKALEIYNAGRTKKTLGNMLLWGSIIPLSVFLRDAIRDTNGEVIGYQTTQYGGQGIPIMGPVSKVPLILGGAMIIAAIPIKIGFSKKVKKAVDLINEPPPKTVGNIESSSMILNQNGLGLAIKF